MAPSHCRMGGVFIWFEEECLEDMGTRSSQVEVKRAPFSWQWDGSNLELAESGCFCDTPDQRTAAPYLRYIKPIYIWAVFTVGLNAVLSRMRVCALGHSPRSN
ncbi:hypothetical protein GCM10010981_00820 [Dyella nitratireducens]|uniref:Uncharacterized protein n=1 Tax=Dyella nitratireducens TaxID=1849580 RepID=A0ABQ1FJF0_9GAMM|nr:hypothetical protein GCM10010981_00820 [Dyella nitratireducens]GLQ44857.1 hypothetical protein GCM10007902_47070 [Dyella nitratireducens]